MATPIQRLPEGTLNHLQKKILLTLAFLALYRIGAHIPIPGVNTFRLGEYFRSQGANVFGMLNMFSGGGMERFSLFALGVMPYITSSICIHLMTFAVPHLEALSKEGDSGRRRINQYTRYATVILALIQGWIMVGHIETREYYGGPLVLDGGLHWRLMALLSLCAGSAFVMWLGEQITEHGVGNGMSLIIFSSIVATLPGVVTSTYTQFNSQQIDMFRVLLLLGVCSAVVLGVVFMEQGARQIPIQYAKRQVGRRVYGGQTSHLPMKLNTAGVMPPIFANSMLQIPLTLVATRAANSEWGSVFSQLLYPGGWLYNVVYVILIIFFSFFYTSMTFKSDDIAENLKKNGGFIPGIRPGARTAEYLNRVLERLTLSGAIYLSAVCVLPSILSSRFNVPFYFGGTSLLIVVGVALETFRQVEAHRQSLRYDAYVRNSAVRARRGGGGGA